MGSRDTAGEDDNCMEQVLRKLTWKEALLDLLLVNRVNLMSTVEIGGCLGQSEHEMIEFKISVDRRESASKTSALDMRRSEFRLLRKLAGVTSIEAMLLRMQLRWAGHVFRMEDHRLPTVVLYGELATSCHNRGAPEKRYKDSLTQHLSLGHIDCHQWSTLASSWDSWRHTIHDAAASFENRHRVSLEEKRQCRKNHSLPI
ncbi:hypothetical protein WISP_08744 [Willisornis vidua]|uniref:Uncharacterized protein n=1 Tax=Willisornis vidua TaxID=1566151 RepID=A0ABQ9DWM6_9PASS|nr:hypothetical protein WISP_08744 [Willisornis vidua]